MFHTIRKRERECNYRSEWQSSGISTSKKGIKIVNCDVCSSGINIGHEGIGDIKKHCNSQVGEDLSSIIIGDEENKVADEELGIVHKAWELISAQECCMDSNITNVFQWY